MHPNGLLHLNVGSMLRHISLLSNGEEPGSTKSLPESFEEDFAEFTNSMRVQAAKQSYDRKFELSYVKNVADDVEIPRSLLLGPWDEEMTRRLFWLVYGSARVSFIKSTSGEIGRLGLRRAIAEGNHRLIRLLVWAGVHPHDPALMVWALRNVGGDKVAIIDQLISTGLSADSFSKFAEALDIMGDEAVHRGNAEKLLFYNSLVGNQVDSPTAMRAALHTAAPSPNLLKFLKSQSEGLCFFSSNPRPGFIFDHRGLHLSTPIAKLPLKPSTRYISTTLPHRATVEAGFVNFEFLWPRSAPPALHAQSQSTNSRRNRKPAFENAIVWSRNKSTNSRKWTWAQRIWRSSAKKGGKTPGPDDISRNDGRDPAFGRGRAIKAADEPRLRCTEFDENGNMVLQNGEFKKSELIAKYGLLPRDLRKIDSSVLPHILVRPSAILINLLHLRVLIKANRVLVFDSYGSTNSHTQSVFIQDLTKKLTNKSDPKQSASAGNLPYEFRALESVLISVTVSLEAEFETVREPVKRVLRELEEDIDRNKLRHLLVWSKKLGTFEQRAKLVRDAIDELLEADDDLAAMYLTEKSHDLIRGEDDHTEVEMLLESYHKLCDEIVQESGNLVSNIRNTEEIVKAILDANRNSLMLLDLKFSIGTLGIGSGAFIAALYGMNLKNFMEESTMGFWGVTGWCLFFSGIVCSYGLKKLQKVQKVKMSGESGRNGRSWREDEGEDGGAWARREREMWRGRARERDRNGHSNGNGNGDSECENPDHLSLPSSSSSSSSSPGKEDGKAIGVGVSVAKKNAAVPS
ncbi:hypothetical protein B7494_g2743 [Chlorociboria aeruginascens]|nr:hypothetical protein B7494_g2743 [Chlorociboria aeruginascens]